MASRDVPSSREATRCYWAKDQAKHPDPADLLDCSELWLAPASAELQSFLNRCIRRDLEMIVTTEKDAVRFPRLTKVDVPIYFLRVEIEILK